MLVSTLFRGISLLTVFPNGFNIVSRINSQQHVILSELVIFTKDALNKTIVCSFSNFMWVGLVDPNFVPNGRVVVCWSVAGQVYLASCPGQASGRIRSLIGGVSAPNIGIMCNKGNIFNVLDFVIVIIILGLQLGAQGEQNTANTGLTDRTQLK